MQSSEQQHAVDTIMMLNLWMIWLRHREVGLFMRPQWTPGNVAFESMYARQTSLDVPVSFSSLKSSACSLPAQPGLNRWDHTQALFSLSISLAAPHQCPRGDKDSVNSLRGDFLRPASLGYPHIPDASPILLFAKTSRFVTWNDLLIVSFPLASFQGFVANVKCCLKNVFLLAEEVSVCVG